MRWLLIVLLACGLAHADEPAPPWARGVPTHTQEAANALFAEANALFARDALPPALDKYRGALALWDHPLIRFNYAVTLIRLERYVEARVELDRALVYGRQPFDDEQYNRVLAYQRMLDERVVTRRQRGRLYIAAGLVGGGVVAVATSLVTGYYANRLYDEQFANGNCITGTDGELRCNPEGFRLTDRARTWGQIGTGLAIGGGALVVAGAIVYFTAPRERILIAPAATRESASITVTARF